MGAATGWMKVRNIGKWVSNLCRILLAREPDKCNMRECLPATISGRVRGNYCVFQICASNEVDLSLNLCSIVENAIKTKSCLNVMQIYPAHTLMYRFK